MLLAWPLFVYLAALVAAEPAPVEQTPFLGTPRKHLIFMVSDGMGPASLSLARSFRQFRDQLAYNETLVLDQHLIGALRTLLNLLLVTDSAAGAVAFALGIKTYNGAIGVTADKVPVGTILEAAKLQRHYKTGLVVTTRITDATPAAFLAHADYRFQEDLIAEQQIGHYELGRVVDLIIGGGRCHFQPVAAGGCRADQLDLVQKASESGWQFVGSRAGFDELDGGKNVSLPLLALLAEGDIPFDLDRDARVHPSLEELAATALTALFAASKADDESGGMFLLIEGSRIDHAGHQNDPAAQVRETLAYDKAFEHVVEFARKHLSPTDEFIVLSTSDHETGGLAVARQVTPLYPEYAWYPEALLNASHSGEYVANELKNYKGLDPAGAVKQQLEKSLGIVDYTQADVDFLVAHLDNPIDKLVEMVSVRSQTGWSTHGHSAVDVNIYGYLPREATMLEVYKALAGNHENVEIGQFMRRWLDVGLESVTKRILGTKHSPGAVVEALLHAVEEELDDAYHHLEDLE